ncbi:MAG: hypothetical protein WC325_09605 [Candidatus Bathyarchaeia archaeon]|jgi:hypothetical protein
MDNEGLKNEIDNLKRVFEDHVHMGTDTKKIPYANLSGVPDTSVDDSNVVFTDITTGDVSTSKHGYVPKAPNDTAKFLRGDATWGYPVVVTASDDLKQSANTERYSTSLTYEKKKEMTVHVYGTIRVKFDMRSDASDGFVSGRIYKNDIAVGTVRSNNGDYITYSEDLTGIVPNDKIQIYLKRDSVSVFQADVQNFRIYYNFYEVPTVNTD